MSAAAMALPPGAVLDDSSAPPNTGGMKLPPGAVLEAAPPTGEEFKQQAWSQAGQDIRQGHVLNAAKDVGSLLTSKNPAMSDWSMVSGLKSLLPQSTPMPEMPGGSLQAFQKLPQDQQDAYRKQVSDWRANQMGGSLQLGLGFLSPKMAGTAVNTVKEALPSTERAGQAFQDVMSAAKNQPVQLTNAQDGILKLMDWQKKTALGPTVNKFLNRVTTPNQGPLTYKEARDFYQLLGKMSADETSKLAPAVRRDLTQMVVGLKSDVGDAAASVGKGQQYYDAMSEFRSAKKLEDLSDATKDVIVRALKYAIGGGLGGFAAREGFNAFHHE